MKKMLNITNHQCNANKTSMRNHLTPVRIAVIKKNKQCWRGYGEFMQNSAATMENSIEIPQKIKNRTTR